MHELQALQPRPLLVTISSLLCFKRASQVVLVVKNLPANTGDVRDTGLIPGLERSLEKDMATPSSILAWRISWAEEAGPWGHKESDTAEVT